MSELRRLSEDPSLGAFDRAVLSSASSDRASPRARLAAEAALGLAAIGAATAHTSTAAAATAKMAGASKLAGFITAAKAFAVVAAVGSIAYVSTPLWRSSPHASVPMNAPAMPTATGAPRIAPPIFEEPAARAETISIDALPNAAPSPLAKRAPSPSRETTTAAPVANDSRLGEEVARIESARGKLAARDGRAALAILDAYASEFADGALAPEASALRADAFVVIGDRAGARAAARAYLARHPRGGAAARMAEIVKDDPRDQNAEPTP